MAVTHVRATRLRAFALVAICGAGYTKRLDFSEGFSLLAYVSQSSFLLPMRFTLIDRIIELEPGTRITALKALSMAEEYLADHFPGFPVMPGVLMLEAMTQASAWLVRASEDFAHSMVVLRQAGNVKYGQFVEPGHSLTVTAEILSQTENLTKLKARGVVDGQTSVSARLTLERYNLADTQPNRADTDALLKEQLRNQFALLYREGGKDDSPPPA